LKILNSNALVPVGGAYENLVVELFLGYVVTVLYLRHNYLECSYTPTVSAVNELHGSTIIVSRRRQTFSAESKVL
jgi:hypothetical protein